MGFNFLGSFLYVVPVDLHLHALNVPPNQARVERLNLRIIKIIKN